MTVASHLIVAHAGPPLDGLPPEPPPLVRALHAIPPEAAHDGDPWSLTPPHEHALATALGWTVTDGALPWAAWSAQRVGLACAWLHPCQWQASLDHIQIVPAQALAITAEEAQALADALTPLAAEDGWRLYVESAQRWRLEGPALDSWRGASLSRVAHRRADPWWRRQRAADMGNPAGRALLRLLNEAQMLYDRHPVNTARAARGLPAVNGLWLDGAGVWPGDGPTPANADVALMEGWTDGPAVPVQDWSAAWQRLSDTVLVPWLRDAAKAGADRPHRLTLCGQRGWRRWQLDRAQCIALARALDTTWAAAIPTAAPADGARAPGVPPARHSGPWWQRLWPWGGRRNPGALPPPHARRDDDGHGAATWWSAL